MSQNCLDTLQDLFKNARSDLQNLKVELDKVQLLIAEDKLIPDALSDSVRNMLSVCRNSKTVLTDTVEKYAVSAELSISDMEAEVSKKLAASEIRQLLVDYFRLTSEADSVLEKLNDAKRALKEKCMLPHDELQAALDPYRVVVDYVSGKTAEITDEQSELIEDTMGRSISRAIDKGQLAFGDIEEGEKWLDGIEGLPGQQPVPPADDDPGPVNPPDKDPGDGIIDNPPEPLPPEPVPEKMWPALSGYVSDTNVTFKDVSAANVKMSDFKSLIRKKPVFANVLWNICSAKVFPIEASPEQYSDAKLSGRPVIDGLTKKNYISTVTYTEPDGSKAEYAHITSMGHETLVRCEKEKMPPIQFKRWQAKNRKPVFSGLYFSRCRLLREWLLTNPDVIDISNQPDIFVSENDLEYVFCSLQQKNDKKVNYIVPALFAQGSEQKWIDIITEALKNPEEKCVITIIANSENDIPILRDALCSDHPDFESDLIFTVISDENVKELPPKPVPVPPVEKPRPPKTVPVPPVDTTPPAPPVPPKEDIDAVRSKIAEYEKKAYEAFASDRWDVGSVILKSLCMKARESNLEDEYLKLSQSEECYAYATGDPMLTKDYRTSNLQTVFNLPYGNDESYDTLAISAFLRMFFSADAGIEAYGTASLQFANNITLKNNPALANLIYQLTTYVGENFTGIDDRVLSIAFKHGNVSEKIVAAQKVAGDLCVGNHLLYSSHGHRRIVENRKLLFGPGTILRTALETVAQNDIAQAAHVKEAMSLVDNRVIPQTIEHLMDKTWDTTAQTKDKASLIGAERNALTKLLLTVYHTLEDWLSAVHLSASDTSVSKSASVQKILSVTRTGLLEAQGIFKEKRNSSTTVEIFSAQRILENTVAELLERFETPDKANYARDSYYIHLLEHPLIAVTEGFVPYIEVPEEETSEFNFCDRACEYLTLPRVDWTDAITRFSKKSADRSGGDYGCACLLHDYLEIYEPAVDVSSIDSGILERLANEAKNPKSKSIDAVQAWQQDFQGRLDMADGDEWFKEPDKRRQLERIINEQKRSYYFSDDFGFYGRAMLRVLKNMSDEAEHLRSEYESTLKTAQSSGTIPADAPIYDLAYKMIQKNRFGAFRSYLQMAERGETDVIESRLSDQFSYFNKFCMQCSELCSKARLNKDQTLLSVYRRSGLYRENAMGRTALSLTENWPESESSNPQNQAKKVKAIIEALGIRVSKASSEGTGIHLTLENPGRVEFYPHPIADFGSRMYTNGLQVQALYGNLTSADVLLTKVREIFQKNKQQSFLILANCAIPLDERRRFARLVADNMITSPFIVVDRALALYLTGIQQAERWKAMLQCTLPFQVINPYSENNIVEIPPEMFIGRTSELESIRRPDGANLIYGGRQLGKTALLKRARVLEHRPDANSWAVYEDIKNKNSAEAAVRIAKTLVQEKFFTSKPDIQSWDKLIECIENRLMGNSDRLLLLLDEADVFLFESGKDNYREIDDLKHLQDRSGNRFKCVMAGLHNVLRFDNARALTNNSSLAHLQGLTVKPLDFKDARALLELPLSYLGFSIPEEDEDIITQILYNTNYFPGLVHFYANRLVKYANSHSNTMKEPPYELKTDTLLSLLAEQDFHDMRNDRIKMTLYIDANEHSYYDILATTMCYGYNVSDEYKLYGMTAKDIRSECVSLEPRCSISRLSDTQLEALLNELVTLNIFRVENNRYQFRRASFTEIFSSMEEIETHFLEILSREVQ